MIQMKKAHRQYEGRESIQSQAMLQIQKQKTATR